MTIPIDALILLSAIYAWVLSVLVIRGQHDRRYGNRRRGAWTVILSPLWPVALVAVPFAILWLLGLGAVRTAKWFSVLFRDAAGRTR